MRARATLIVAATVTLLVPSAFLLPVLRPIELRLNAQGAAAALSGGVSSSEEGKMEGVAITAERQGANFRVSVFSDAHGQYSFPRTRLADGTYTLTIRAAGYDLVPPGPVQVATGKMTTLNLALKKTADLTKQLSSREWILSMPGSDDIKNKLVAAGVSCTYCHSLERVVKSKYTAEQWLPVLNRMHKYFIDGTSAPQGTGRGHAEFEEEPRRSAVDTMPDWWGLGTIKIPKTELATFLASVNLSGGRTQFPYELKPLPRPKGVSTRIIVTAWDAPRKDATFHDGETDTKGRVWFSSENANIVGVLDPKTNTFTDYPIERNEANAKPGARDIIIDKADNVWLPMRLAGGLGGAQVLYRFNTRTHEVSRVEGFEAGAYGDPDPSGAYVWLAFVRVNAKTAKMDGDFRSPKSGPKPTGYGFAVNSKGNPYGTDFGNSTLTAVDVAKNEGKVWPTPRPDMQPRRGRMDAQDRFWMAFHGGDALAMFDTRSEKWTEWRTPKFTTPYTASLPDRNGFIYSPTHTAEAILRLNPKTGEIIQFAMPTTPGNFDTKKLSYDPTTKGTTLLFANTRNAQIMRVEFLD